MYAVLRRAPLWRRAVSALGFRETGAAGAAARPQFAAEEGSFYEDGKRAPAGVGAAAAEGLEIAKLGISSKIVERLASKGITKLFPIQTPGLLRSSTHVRSYSSQLSALIPATSQCSILTRKRCYLPNPSLYQVWSRSFASDNGDKFEAVVPFMGESVTDGTLANFLKKPGDRVEADEPIAQIETDEVTIDVASPEAGVIEKLIASEGDTVTPGTKVAIISKSAQPAETHVAPSEEATPKKSSPPQVEEKPKVEEKAPKVEPPKVQAPKPTAPLKTSPSEPQLPPKERERRQVLGYEPTPHLSGAQVLPRWFSSLASNGSPVQKSQSDAQKSSEEATPKVVAFSPLEAAIAKPRSSPLTSESSKVRRSEIATQVTFYIIPALLLVSKNSISTSLLVGAVFHQVYMFHKEILLDYVHHDITRKWSLIYFKLLLLVMAKDTIMYFNLF